jgi:hypothetical protein
MSLAQSTLDDIWLLFRESSKIFKIVYNNRMNSLTPVDNAIYHPYCDLY